MRRFWGAGTAIVAVAALSATVGVAVPAQADSGRLDPRQVRGSIAYLRKTYGVTEREALRRLELQAKAESLAGVLERRSASYGGMWIDHARGGALVVAAKAPGEVSGLLAGLRDRAHVTVTRVSRSLSELRAIRQRVAAEVGDGPDSVLLPRIDERGNQVVVWRRDWLAPARPFAVVQAETVQAETVQAETVQAQGQTALDRVMARYPGTVVVRSAPEPNPLSAQGDVGQCHPLYCTGYGPMRGGLRLDIQRDDGTWGGCTSGFNVRARGGDYDGQAFVLTAGHCVVSARHQHQDFAYHQSDLVLREEAGLAVNNFPYDYALLPYANQSAANTWLNPSAEHNLVLAWCRNGGMDSDANTPCADGENGSVDGRIHIRSVAAAAEVHDGWVVCATGAGASSADYPDVVDTGAGAGYRPGTRCGIVTGQSNGAIDTDLCARAGDSGGPLFSEVTSTGIGILEGNTQDRSGPCAAGESNNYIPLSTVLGSINGQAAARGSRFAVITTTNG